MKTRPANERDTVGARLRRWLPLAPWLPLLAAGVALAAGLSDADVDLDWSREQVQRHPGPIDFVLLSTGGIAGWHEPCGCTSNQSGGFGRRVGLDGLYAESLPDVPRLWLDAGDLVAPGAPHAAAVRKTRAQLEILGRLEATALNLAAGELGHGLAEYVALAKEEALPLLSSSLKATDGEPVPWADHLVVEVGKRRLGLLGLMQLPAEDAPEALLGDRELSVLPLAIALKQGKQRLSDAGVDLTVVLAAVPPDDMKALDDELVGVDLILGTAGKSRLSEQVGDVRFAYAGDRGRLVIEMNVAPRDADVPLLRSRYHELERRFPNDADARELQRTVTREVNDIHREEAQARAAASPRRKRSNHVAAESCRACHVQEYLAWEGSKHAHAMETLVKAGSEFTPDCTSCHSTGFGQEGGFLSLSETRQLADVQCEACHGPGREHAASGGRVEMGPVGEAGCVGCHDPDNSPEFDFATYWPKIAHGSGSGR
ncbi:MAG: multiheme c-type cytochrome [Acidobacteriota bacterium]